MKKFSIKDIINTSMSSLMKTKRNTLRSMHSILNKRISSIVKQFKKHGREDELPQSLTKKRSSNMSNAELVTSIGDMSNILLNSKYESYSKWRARYNKNKADYRKLVGKKRVSDAEYDEYRKWMNDMYEMYKNIMDPYELYNNSQDLWVTARRLNLDVRQFEDNIEKWSKRMEKLTENIPDNQIIKGKDLEVDVYLNKLDKVASWLDEED